MQKLKNRMFFENFEISMLSLFENCCRILLFVREVLENSSVGSFSITKIFPLKSLLDIRNHAIDVPIIAPPAITTS